MHLFQASLDVAKIVNKSLLLKIQNISRLFN